MRCATVRTLQIFDLFRDCRFIFFEIAFNDNDLKSSTTRSYKAWSSVVSIRLRIRISLQLKMNRTYLKQIDNEIEYVKGRCFFIRKLVKSLLENDILEKYWCAGEYMMNSDTNKTKGTITYLIIVLKLFVLLLCIVNIDVIHGMKVLNKETKKPYQEEYEEKLRATYENINKIIPKMSPENLYEVFTNSQSDHFQQLAKNTSVTSQGNIFHFELLEQHAKQFKIDFIQIASTDAGKELLTKLLCNIFTKSDRSGKNSLLPTPFIKQACKSVKIQRGTLGSEFEWQDGMSYNVLVSTLKYTPEVVIKIPVISGNEVKLENCRSDIALFHELIHWLHGMENYSLYTDGKSSTYHKDIIDHETTAVGKRKNCKMFHEILSYYSDLPINDALVKMWSKKDEREKHSKKQDFIIEMEEMRTVCGRGELSENVYRSEIKAPLRACYTDFFINTDEHIGINEYLEKSRYLEGLHKTAQFKF